MRCKIFAIGKIRTGTKSQQNRHFKNTNAKNGGYYLKNLPFIIKVSDSTKNEFASIIIELRFNLLKASKIKSSKNFPFDRVVQTHELLRTPRTPTNSNEPPLFTKTRTPKNNIFWSCYSAAATLLQKYKSVVANSLESVTTIWNTNSNL